MNWGRGFVFETGFARSPPPKKTNAIGKSDQRERKTIFCGFRLFRRLRCEQFHTPFDYDSRCLIDWLDVFVDVKAAAISAHFEMRDMGRL